MLLMYHWVHALLTGEYAEEYDLNTFWGDYVASVGLDWNGKSWEVTGTCWGGTPKELEGKFANRASLEAAIKRHVRCPETVQEEF